MSERKKAEVSATVRKRNRCFITTIILSAVYLLWRIFFTIPWNSGFIQAAAGIMLAAAEAVTTAGTIELMVSRMKSRDSGIVLPDIPDELYPDVDVLIATHNEPEGLLYKTVNACTFLEYPDRKKVHIYVCDDGNRKEIRKMAEGLGVGYFGLADNTHAKSGNYNHALSRTASQLVATFDADMIPRRNFLLKTVPYFLVPGIRIALVQTPQSFYNQDLFQFNLFSEKEIPNEQDFFSREINVMRNATNTAAYTGSNTVILRAALEEIGGFPYDTVTEDFETSLRLQKAGYITYASSEVLAAGLSTTTVESMISQRVRWARGGDTEHTEYKCCFYTEAVSGSQNVLSECVSVLVVVSVQDDIYTCPCSVCFVRIPPCRVRFLGIAFVLASVSSFLPRFRGISQWKYT